MRTGREAQRAEAKQFSGERFRAALLRGIEATRCNFREARR